MAAIARAAALLLVMLAAPAQAQSTCNISQVLTTNSALTQLSAAVQATPAAFTALSNVTGAWTIFAPNDAAFTSLLTTLDSLSPQTVTLGSLVSSPANIALTNNVLRYHIYPGGAVLGSAVPTVATSLPTAMAGNNNFTVLSNNGVVTVASAGGPTATVVTPNAVIPTTGCNVVVHIVDTVLLPITPAAALAAYGLGSCNITGALSGIPAISSLYTAISALPAIVTTLNTVTTPITVFAPTNAAFASLLNALNGLTNPGTVTLGTLVSNSNASAVTQTVVSYHVLTGAYTNSATLVPPATLIPPSTTGTVVPTILGATSTLRIIKATATSGVSVVGAGSTANVATPDFNPNFTTTCGVTIHIVDTVLLPVTPAAAAGLYGLPACTPLATAAPTLPNITTFSAALSFAYNTSEIAGLLATPSTIFVPNDAAFRALLAKIGMNATTLLSANNKPLVRNLLAYHIIPGNGLLSTALAATQTAGTAFSSTATLTVNKTTAGGVTVAAALSTATVITPNLGYCSNIVVHVVDTVLVPQAAAYLLPPAPAPKAPVSGARATAASTVLAVAITFVLAAAGMLV